LLIITQGTGLASEGFDLHQCAQNRFAKDFLNKIKRFVSCGRRSDSMTQHLSPQDTEADRRAMRQLATVIGCFAIAAALMAVAVGLVMG
jgi:hypothetical protein